MSAPVNSSISQTAPEQARVDLERVVDVAISLDPVADDEAPPQDSDFIETYARYADVLEAPREAHEWVATQLIATILNRNGVTIPHGALTYSLDLWLLLLSGSGFGRSTLIGLTRPILEEADLTEIERDAHWGSLQSVYQQSADNLAALWTWGEMSERLKLLSQPQFAGAKEWITDRYDNFKPPAPITYRHTGKGKDTPPIASWLGISINAGTVLVRCVATPCKGFGY